MEIYFLPRLMVLMQKPSSFPHLLSIEYNNILIYNTIYYFILKISEDG